MFVDTTTFDGDDEEIDEVDDIDEKETPIEEEEKEKEGYVSIQTCHKRTRLGLAF